MNDGHIVGLKLLGEPSGEILAIHRRTHKGNNSSLRGDIQDQEVLSFGLASIYRAVLQCTVEYVRLSGENN